MGLALARSGIDTISIDTVKGFIKVSGDCLLDISQTRVVRYCEPDSYLPIND
jgi:hypothetical protein